MKLKYDAKEGIKYNPNEQPVECWLSMGKNLHTRALKKLGLNGRKKRGFGGIEVHSMISPETKAEDRILTSLLQ